MKRLLKSLFRKKRKNEAVLKYVMYLLHLWLGLLSSVVLFVLCISGCMYAFKTQIAELYNYDKIFVEKGNKLAQTPGELQHQLRNQQKELLSVVMPKSSKRSWSISYKEPNGNIVGSYYDPYARNELGSGNQNLDGFFEVVLDLHQNLLMGNIGRQIGGASVLMFLVLVFSGFILWLPKKLKYLKQNLTIKTNAKFKRLNHDLHNVLGFYSMIFLVFIAITGIYITYPWVKNAVIVSLGGTSISKISSAETKEEDAFAGLMDDMLNRESEKKELSEVRTVSLQAIVYETNRHFPHPGTLSIEFPNAENPRFMVKKINDDNFLGALLPDELSFDKTGQLKTKEIFLNQPLNKQFSSLSKPLHTGEIMGLGSIVFYFIITLIGAMLPVTGIIMWWHRLKKLKE